MALPTHDFRTPIHFRHKVLGHTAIHGHGDDELSNVFDVNGNSKLRSGHEDQREGQTDPNQVSCHLKPQDGQEVQRMPARERTV